MSEPLLSEVYGLVVEAPIALPGWPVAAGTRTDVRVRFGAAPEATRDWERLSPIRVHTSDAEAGLAPALIAERSDLAGYLRLDYAEGIRFHVSIDGREVWAEWQAPLTAADAVSFLLGPVLGVALRPHGVVPVHASAVVLGGRAWAFVGPGGAGKSTLAAAFAARGVPMLTEDVLALRREADGTWRASPGYGEVRVWDESIELLGPHGTQVPALSPTWPKRGLDLRARSLPFARDAVPLAGLFVLDELRPHGAPACAPLGVADTLLDLVAHAYVNYLVPPELLGSELKSLASVAAAVRRWRLSPGAGREGLDATISSVIAITSTA